MAAFNTFLSEEQLMCSICLDIFTNPVSTSCGHNFCMVCLNKSWDNSQKCDCPLCKKDFSSRPQLCVNTFISCLAAQFKESVKVNPSTRTKTPPAAQRYVPCDVCSEPSQTALKSCLYCGISFCGAHLEHHKTVAKLRQHKLIDPVKNLEDYICQRHQRPLELFCKNDQKCVCLFCIEGPHSNHNTISIEEESAEKKTKMQKTRADVQKMIQDRLKKIVEMKHFATLKKENIDKEKEDSAKLFRCLTRSIKSMHSDVLKVLEEKQKDTERQAEGFVKELEWDIAEFKRGDGELEKLLLSEDHLHFLQACLKLSTPVSKNNWEKMKINSSLSVDDVIGDLLHLQQSVQNLTEKVSKLINPDYQREEITRLLMTPFKKGDTWYLVDTLWFNKWKKYVGFHIWDRYYMREKMCYPGPVDNSGILNDSLSIKNHLHDQLDYILLPEEAWGKLISWYGLTEHQNPIARKVVEEGFFVKRCKVEVYPTKLT